ncbi:hypothetical protein OIU85_002577 [Salix viminalis]|uniref:S-locus glycoprotein domain-containing protein n=1 Tax=Salix viminalis TaxID=40686 RepID=A0A9Q0VR62_SALVM|nr:hypothetical protein OIU85_002577 [Salix viminalis]
MSMILALTVAGSNVLIFLLKFSAALDMGNPEVVSWKGSKKYFRSAPWNGIGFSGAPEIRPNRYFSFDFISNDKELYYTYNLIDKSIITRVVLNQTTNHRQRCTWNTETQSWIPYVTEPRDDCDNYGRCGPNGKCIISAMPPCQCLEKFKPKSQEAWNTMDWYHGDIYTYHFRGLGDTSGQLLPLEKKGKVCSENGKLQEK